MKKYKKYFTDRQFQELAASIKSIIDTNSELPIGDQKEQVEMLFISENKFHHNIGKYKQTVHIYHRFINFIVNHHGNILVAKPFFREKSHVHPAILKAIKEGNALKLMEFKINFQLMDFIIKNWKGKIPERVNKYYLDAKKARQILIENNLPLAINRAKTFYRKTSRSSLGLLDLIDICTYGLIVGIDKYAGEYNQGQWANVCIGRMVGFMIEEYSKTFLKLYPMDKKILYRANTLKHRMKIDDITELTKAVNESFEQDLKNGKKIPKSLIPVSEIKIITLLNGSNYYSSDSKYNPDTPDEDEGKNVYDVTSSVEDSVEEKLIKKDLLEKISIASKDLTIKERKVIKLKGVRI